MEGPSDRQSQIGAAGAAATPAGIDAAIGTAGGPSAQHLQRGSGAPLHHQLYLIIRDGIQTGRYPHGMMLPSEGELVRMFGISRITVRAALASLELDGLVSRRQGKGTFVTSGGAPLPIHATMADVLTHMQDVSRRTTVEVVECAILPAAHQVRVQFGAEAGELFLRAVRIRHTPLQPVMLLTTFIPFEIGQHITSADLEHYPLTQLMKRAGAEITSGHQIVSATLAEPIVARHLRVNVGSALLMIRRLHFDANNRPVLYMEMLASPANFELRMSLEADDGNA